MTVYKAMSKKVSEESLSRIRNFVEKYCAKSGTTTHPDKEITEAVVLGLAHHSETLGKPLCPCRFYPNKEEEIKHLHGFVPATICRFTSTATACFL